jgi:hypothetical protein
MARMFEYAMGILEIGHDFWNMCCAVFLGHRATALDNPLSAVHVYRKHPDYGVFYLNWTVSSLLDGDVLMVRNHDDLFTAANACANQVFKVAPIEAFLNQEVLEKKEALTDNLWRHRLWTVVSDPSSGWCAVKL